MVKLLLSDYDGTFLTLGGDLNRNIEAVKRWRAMGRKFGIITGRSLDSIKRQLTEHYFEHDYLGLDNGAVVADSNGRVFWSTHLSDSLTAEIYEFLRPQALDIAFWSVDVDKSSEILLSTTKIRARFNNMSEAINIANTLAKRSAGRFITIPMLAQEDSFGYIEVAPVAAGKVTAVEKILEMEGLDASEVAVIGDAYNDLEMIKKYHGFAIGSAIPEVKAVASRAVASVADLINELIT